MKKKLIILVTAFLMLTGFSNPSNRNNIYIKDAFIVTRTYTDILGNVRTEENIGICYINEYSDIPNGAVVTFPEGGGKALPVEGLAGIAWGALNQKVKGTQYGRRYWYFITPEPKNIDELCK